MQIDTLIETGSFAPAKGGGLWKRLRERTFAAGSASRF